MKSLMNALYLPIIAFALLVTSTTLNAHMMVAQHGTINIVDNGAFLVLSLPVTAFDGIDDDSDGKLSKEEFKTHRSAISKSVLENITLSGNYGAYPLKGLMLSPVYSHEELNQPVTQLIIIGKFILEDTNETLWFQAGLLGKGINERILEVTATNSNTGQTHVFTINPEVSTVALFLK